MNVSLAYIASTASYCLNTEKHLPSTWILTVWPVHSLSQAYSLCPFVRCSLNLTSILIVKNIVLERRFHLSIVGLPNARTLGQKKGNIILAFHSHKKELNTTQWIWREQIHITSILLIVVLSIWVMNETKMHPMWCLYYFLYLTFHRNKTLISIN